MPFYQFNSFTGRIVESTHPQPYFPISAKPLDSAEPPKIMFDTPKTKPVKVAPALSTAAYSTVPESVLRKIKIFQANNPLPVHLKGGAADRGLLGLTMLLCGVGLVGSFKLFYDLGFKKN